MFTRVTDLIVLVGVLFSSTLSSAGQTVLRRPLETLRTNCFLFDNWTEAGYGGWESLN